MSSYYFYQTEGGNEAWKVVPVADVNKLGEHMFRTILSLDVIPNDSFSKEEYHAIKYSGPLYFDLDDAASPASTAKDLVALIEKLKKLDVEESCMAIYASGGKGFHLTIDQQVFIEKPAKGYAHLPAMYKEIAFDLATRSTDFRVYTAKSGRMFRVANVKRPNGLYKVQLSTDEVREIAAGSGKDAEELYRTICSSPREPFPVGVTRAFGLQGMFDTVKKRVEGLVKKAAKQKPVSLPDELPSFEALLQGRGVRDDAGFNEIAMQVAITAHARGMSAQELVTAAQGLITNHSSDGNRYNSPDKRRRELIRMHEYVEDSPCYAYSPGAIRFILTHEAPDLAGIEASVEEVEEGINNPVEKGANEYDHAGVILTKGGVSIPVDGGAKKVLALGFSETTEMVSSQTGNTAVIQAKVHIAGEDGRSYGERTFDPESFSSANSLNKVVMQMGQVFTGDDKQARGLYLRLVEKSRRGGRRVYVVNREGVDFVAMPFHSDPLVQQGLMVYADRESVMLPGSAHDIDDFRLKFVGFPHALGIYQSDLSRAPRMSECTEQHQKDLKDCIWNLLHCQTPEYLGKLVGWQAACHYRMLFHKVYDKFPLLHVNGPAGAGKTSMVRLTAFLHYYLQDPKVLTPSSTMFAIKEAAAASASIPLVIDEFKPHEISQARYDEFKMMFRDAYNCRDVSRGGGTRDSTDYRVLQTSQLAAPICFVAEAVESEAAVMERVVLLTLVKPPAIRQEAYLNAFNAAWDKRSALGILGAFLARAAVNTYTKEKLKAEFDVIYDKTRSELMLTANDFATLTPEERMKKAGTKERTVYNYSVLRFGLQKFATAVERIFKTDPRLEEIKSILDQMYASSTSTVTELQSQTVPEWLRVFNSFSSMANADNFAPYKLVKTKHYDYEDSPEGEILVINPRECYGRYRMFCATRQEKALYPGEQAFLHAVGNLPGRVNHTPSMQGQQLVSFSLDELRAHGFIDIF